MFSTNSEHLFTDFYSFVNVFSPRRPVVVPCVKPMVSDILYVSYAIHKVLKTARDKILYVPLET